MILSIDYSQEVCGTEEEVGKGESRLRSCGNICRKICQSLDVGREPTTGRVPPQTLLAPWDIEQHLIADYNGSKVHFVKNAKRLSQCNVKSGPYSLLYHKMIQNPGFVAPIFDSEQVGPCGDPRESTGNHSPGSGTNAICSSSIARFLPAAAALNHPDIYTIHGVEESDDTMFIVMEYIAGIYAALGDRDKTFDVSLAHGQTGRLRVSTQRMRMRR